MSDRIQMEINIHKLIDSKKLENMEMAYNLAVGINDEDLQLLADLRYAQEWCRQNMRYSTVGYSSLRARIDMVHAIGIGSKISIIGRYKDKILDSNHSFNHWLGCMSLSNSHVWNTPFDFVQFPILTIS